MPEFNPFDMDFDDDVDGIDFLGVDYLARHALVPYEDLASRGSPKPAKLLTI